jgi:hypothetical protein
LIIDEKKKWMKEKKVMRAKIMLLSDKIDELEKKKKYLGDVVRR